MRLALLVDPAIGVLTACLKDRKKDPGNALRAADSILDRAGMKDATHIILSGPDDGPVRVEFNAAELTDEQLALAEQFARSIASHRPGPDGGDSGAGS